MVMYSKHSSKMYGEMYTHCRDTFKVCFNDLLLYDVIICYVRPVSPGWTDSCTNYQEGWDKRNVIPENLRVSEPIQCVVSVEAEKRVSESSGKGGSGSMLF